MKLIEYIKKFYSIKDHLPQGSKKKFADSIGISTQQLNNMLYSCNFNVLNNAIWRKASETITKIDGEYYIKTHDLPE